jgi:hypothetical protein
MARKGKPQPKQSAYDAKAALKESLLYAADRYSVDFPGSPLSVMLEIAVGAAVFRAGQARPTADIEAMHGIIDDTMKLVGQAARRPILLKALTEVNTVASRKAIIKKLLVG